jgi:FAD/FMN-containing dehydrogenase
MKDDVLVLDVRRFKSITVDPAKKTVTVGGGCLLGEIDQTLKVHGLACTFGHDPTTGVGGLTLNGGHGFLERKYGLTIDNMIAARVVVASGQVLTASEKSHPELFFGLRGGGGNFGVVVEFVFQCHELPNRGMLLGGAQVHMPFYPLENRGLHLSHFFFFFF